MFARIGVFYCEAKKGYIFLGKRASASKSSRCRISTRLTKDRPMQSPIMPPRLATRVVKDITYEQVEEEESLHLTSWVRKTEM